MEVVRQEPRISVNKLSEYITAMPARRKSIIKQQKQPSSYIVSYYKNAENIITEYLTNNINEQQWIEMKINQLSKKNISSNWSEISKNLCIEAITNFRDISNDIDFKGLICISGESDSPKLNISNVDISVRPEIYLINEKKEIKGCVKLVFGKNREVVKNEAEYTGVCLQRWLKETKNVFDPKSCFILNIFGKNIYTAPKSYKKRMTDIEVACEEIDNAWHKY